VASGALAQALCICHHEPTSEAAEKLALSSVLKGRTFRCAVKALYFGNN
jgi:hypothetical protein